MQFETARLCIRLLGAADAAALLEIQNTDFVLRYNGMEKWDADKMRAYLEKKKGSLFGLFLREGGELIGEIGLTQDSLRYDVGSIELNYYLGEGHSRCGYMTEALAAVLRYLLTDGGYTLVTARSFAPNLASRRLLEGLGFRCEGVLRQCVKGYGGVIFDDALYSVTREEFEAAYDRT